jgi:hypothetical protein
MVESHQVKVTTVPLLLLEDCDAKRQAAQASLCLSGV